MEKTLKRADLEQKYINLASKKLGAVVTSATDDFFAAKERVIEDKPPVFIEDKYDAHGKWMDGWESRRKRVAGHDFCVIKLGAVGIIRALSIDTSFFTGNYPPKVSVEVCCTETVPDETTEWTELLPPTDLGPDREHLFAVEDEKAFNWLRLHIYPDGGIARIKVYGDAVCDWTSKGAEELYELSALANGGRIVGYNDAHYGTVWSLLCPGRGEDMGDGWETRRRRQPGHDWLVLKLGTSGTLEKIEIDTAHFKGNYPDGFSLDAIWAEDLTDAEILDDDQPWQEILARHKLTADSVHHFSDEVRTGIGPVTHIRLNIYPDGGVSRFRAWGKPVKT